MLNTQLDKSIILFEMIVNMNGLQMVLPYKTIYSCRVSVVVSVNCCIIYIYMLCFFFFVSLGKMSDV